MDEGWVGEINCRRLKSLKRKPGSLDLFSPSPPVCILSGLPSWDISCKTCSYRGDIHTCNFALRTVRLRDSTLFKTGNSLCFEKGVPTGLTCSQGKSKGDRGSLTMFFIFSIVAGRVTWGGGCKTGKRQSRSVHAQTRLSITPVTQWRQKPSHKLAGPQRH